jgi:cysteine desulfurase
MADRLVYMDHNATTPLHPEVRKTLSEAMDLFGNPSSMHQFGREARSRIESARKSVARFINAEADEIVFVGSGSEANNTVLNLFPCPSTCCTRQREGRLQVITTKIEHPCVLETSKCLGVKGVDVHFLNVDKTGKINMDQLQSLLSGNTALVSVMMANNEIGTIQDIKTIAHMVHDAGAFFHTDAVQAVGKIPVDVHDLDVDFLSFSAHKIYGPKGVGALYVRKGVHYCPFIHGGHQEKGRRAGTENTLGILGLGRAVEMRKLEMKDEAIRLRTLKKRLQSGIESRIPDIHINGHPEDVLYSTLNVSFERVEGESILLYLDLEGICVSTGSACSSGSLDPSHVILATGTTAEAAHGSIRFSLGRDNTEEDVDYVLDKLSMIIKKLRAMSTVQAPITV